MTHKNFLATVDLGSNSFRLLIAKVTDNDTIHPIDQIKETVRLAAGLDHNHILTTESQEIALLALSKFKERLSGFNKNQVRVVATSTLRVAKNSAEFIAKANNVLGFNIEVISGTEEARLIYIGAMHSIAYSQEKRLIIDIGGGSTEFIIGSGYDPQIMESVTIGCVSFSNRFFVNGELSDNNFNNAILAARSKIQAMEHLFAKHDWIEAIGTSGTAKSLYELCISHGYADKITLEGLYKLKKQFIKYKNTSKLDISGLKEDRRPVIVGGAAILIAIMEELHISEMTIADGALREGVMYDLLGRKSENDLRTSTVLTLKDFYSIDLTQAQNVSVATLQMYINLMGQTKADSEFLKLLQWASELYEVGLCISHNDYHKHGSYILDNSDLAGFSKPEQSILADLVRTHRGNLLKALESLQSRRKIKLKFLYMVLAFRLSVIFNRNRQGFNSSIITIISNSKSSFYISINSEWLKTNTLTLYSLNEEIEQWNKCGITINLIPQ
ncbi:MAG: exopolyphosphatase [Proteobacteria bacterium]|jgi:exopolyphosphatase/guanosine-5'-triphosphate,3'-diphosphate pyrophosphatase|nr:exopolyphosphatase [Pseudomonadota bacterium]